MKPLISEVQKILGVYNPPENIGNASESK